MSATADSSDGRSSTPSEPLDPLAALLASARVRDRVTHVEHVPARPGEATTWPDWLPAELHQAFTRAGIAAPWRHQRSAADLAYAGRHVVLATGTASGKSLAYLLPAVTAALATDATTLYLCPTKALAADQLAAVSRLGVPGLRAAAVDGDTSYEGRDWARSHAHLVLTNPDMAHHVLLPSHQRWASWWRRLSLVVVDECHGYRGVFGSHVALILRRLRRVAAVHGASPTFVLCSATMAEPAASASRLTGLPVVAVTDDASPRAALDFALWQPPLVPPAGGEQAGPAVRRSATAEAGDLLADLVTRTVRTVAFVGSRKGAEAVAANARRALADTSPGLVNRIATYRAGYLAEDRRELESSLRSGDLLGVASTTALELGVDISGLDAVVLTGWPGTRASMWQQAGRAGRAGHRSAAVLIARDDPLDTYLVHHPEAVFGQPVEAAVIDPDNPFVLTPHLAAAAAEVPLTDGDLELFGPGVADALAELTDRGLLRRRPTGWFWTHRSRPGDLADLRGSGGEPVRICELGTGRLLGSVDRAASHTGVHDGAVYVHQGETYLVDTLDLEAGVALVTRATPDWTTSARDVTDLSVVSTHESLDAGGVTVSTGVVDVSSQVVSYLRRQVPTGQVLGEEPLSLPPRELRTQAVWWTVTADLLAAAGVTAAQLPGAAHAAEHASIGLLPLVATCDRWDLGGVSTACHADTGLPTVFVYDGHPGGAGFAGRGFRTIRGWLTATRDALADCGCEAGCPSCVQSPKCGNGNHPLDKAAAWRLLDRVVAELTAAGLAADLATTEAALADSARHRRDRAELTEQLRGRDQARHRRPA